MHHYPEVAAAVGACQRNLEEYVRLQAVSPPENIKTRLLHLIQTDPSLANDTIATGGDTSPITPASVAPAGEKKQVSWKWIATAAAVLLLISVAFNIIYFSLWKEFQADYPKNQSLAATPLPVNEDKIKLEQLKNAMAVMEDPKVLKVIMPGTDSFPTAVATVFWNQDNKQVYLKANNLPEPATGKQYQLWAIVDDKAVDAGVFDMGDKAHLLQKLKIAGNAQMFAITLEKKGGADTPTLGQLYVSGKVPG
nr:anti-sigma factor [Chitinophaga qingshengii]